MSMILEEERAHSDLLQHHQQQKLQILLPCSYFIQQPQWRKLQQQQNGQEEQRNQVKQQSSSSSWSIGSDLRKHLGFIGNIRTMFSRSSDVPMEPIINHFIYIEGHPKRVFVFEHYHLLVIQNDSIQDESVDSDQVMNKIKAMLQMFGSSQLPSPLTTVLLPKNDVLAITDFEPCSDRSTKIRSVFLPAMIMQLFITVAQANTEMNLQTCGLLTGKLKYETYYVTDLIIPKQEATNESCQIMEEEVVLDEQKNELIRLGRIHVIPSRPCSMLSEDMHVQCDSQIKLSESISIIIAPHDLSRRYGIFRLTPEGMKVIGNCKDRDKDHDHLQTQEGVPLYHNGSDVLLIPGDYFGFKDFR